jgi:hypothetical protein
MGYDKLENQMEPVLKAELEAFTSTMSVVTNELSGALKSPELSKGLEVLGAAATIGFTAIETSVKLLADLLKGDADAAKTEIENSYDKIETETKSVLNKLGIDTEELINKIKEQKESLVEKFPVLKLLYSNETSSPENITSNTIPNNVNLTNQDLTNNNLTNQTITPNNTNQNIGIDNKGIENILTFAGESKITIELNSNIPANLLDKVLNEQEVTAVVKEEIRKTFDKSTNNSIINAIPIKIDMG